jgi:hypothetical protein
LALALSYITFIMWRNIPSVLSFFFLFFKFIYSHEHTFFRSFLHPAPLYHPLPSSPTQFQEGPVLPLSIILLKKRHKYNKEDKVFCYLS